MKKFLFTALVTSLSLAPATMAEENDIEIHPLHFGANTTFGKLEGGTVESYGGAGLVSNQPFGRVSAWSLLGATVNERMDINVLLAAMYWYPLPETDGLPHTQYKFLGAGLGNASGTYKFGDVENPFFKVQFGLFDYKYSRASNLGEYLFRSDTYPGVVRSGGWNIINAASYQANGILGSFSLLDNHLGIDVALFLERSNGPNFDISPSVLAKFGLPDIFEVGAGIVFSRLIEIDPDANTPENRRNAYYTDSTGTEVPLPLSQQQKLGYETSRTFIVPDGDARAGQSFNPDPAAPNYAQMVADSTKLRDDGLPAFYYTETENGVPNSALSYYTFKGQKLMAYASVQPLGMVGDLMGLEKSSIYGEVALLGVKDYPFYYDDKAERMPKMFGIDIQFLDRFSLVFEYEMLKSRFQNNQEMSYNEGLPIWYIDTDENQNTIEYADFTANGVDQNELDSFYSLTLSARVTSTLTLYFQRARDHLRTFDYFANPSVQPMNYEDDHHYWLFKMSLGI